jgi:hypothetical protein
VSRFDQLPDDFGAAAALKGHDVSDLAATVIASTAVTIFYVAFALDRTHQP